MNNNRSTIDLRGTDLPRRLRRLRERRCLAKGELAERAQLSYRTVHDLESGRRDRILEKTVMLLATALDVSTADLLGPPTGEDPAAAPPEPAPPSRRAPVTWRRLAAVALGTLAAAAVALLIAWQVSARQAVWEVDGRSLVMRDRWFGVQLWRLDVPEPGLRVAPAPWDDQEFLVGIRRLPGEGGPLRCYARRTGELLWEVRPDLDRVVAAFGEEDVLAAPLNFQDFQPADLDGDDEPELIVRFVHGLYYPSVVCRVDRTGRLLNQYANKGHLYGSVVTDLDGDGKDEVLVAGTNNAKAYQGATFVLLDEDHFRGASVDDVTDPWSSEPDSACVRLVLPHFPAPFRELVGGTRLAVTKLDVLPGAGGSHQVRASVGSKADGCCVMVTLDEALRPVGSDVPDAFLETIAHEWPDSLRNRPGPGSTDWRTAWLDRHVRFEAGREVR